MQNCGKVPGGDVVAVTLHSHDPYVVSAIRQRFTQRFLKRRLVTMTPLQTFFPRLRTDPPIVMEDYKDPMMVEAVLMLKANHTTKPEGGG